MPLNDELLYIMVGERIRATRLRREMTQAQLAEKLKLSRASIVNIEAGRQRAPLHLLWRIAEELGTEVALFIPSQAEYLDGDGPVRLDAETIAQIEAAASDDPIARRGLTEFIQKAKAHAEVDNL
jgi:transcriptional regulator with XRE-family HTH domain